MRKSIPTWRERLQGLDKPTDFAEAQAAKFEAADLRRYIAELEAASQPGEMGAGVRLSGVLTDEQRANAMAIYNSLPHNCQSADTVVTRISATAYANGWRDARNSAPVVAASAQQDEREVLIDALRNEQNNLAASRQQCRNWYDVARWDALQRVIDYLATTQQVQAGGEDKRWQWRYETLRALFPSAPSEQELDAAIDAALSREQSQPSNGDREGGV